MGKASHFSFLDDSLSPSPLLIQQPTCTYLCLQVSLPHPSSLGNYSPVFWCWTLDQAHLNGREPSRTSWGVNCPPYPIRTFFFLPLIRSLPYTFQGLQPYGCICVCVWGGHISHLDIPNHSQPTSLIWTPLDPARTSHGHSWLSPSLPPHLFH